MRVAMCTTEAVPFAKTGGLADVAGALPLALKKVGVECFVTMPFYNSIFKKEHKFEKIKSKLNVSMNENNEEFFDVLVSEIGGINFYFIKKDDFFDRNYLYGTPKGDYRDNGKRFSFFSKAILEVLEELDLSVDTIHLNDYHCGLIPVYLREIKKNNLPNKDFFRNTSTVFTIHNLAYQGIFSKEILDYNGLGDKYFNIRGLEFYGKINFMKGGILFSDKITTVSPSYSKEILTPEYGHDLDGVLRSRQKDLSGIVNGIDYVLWDPEKDSKIVKNYSLNNLTGKKECKDYLINKYFNKEYIDNPLIGVISRLSEQKGIDLIIESMKDILGKGYLLIILGTGEEKYHIMLKKLKKENIGRLSVHILYDDGLARRIYSGSDLFLMPSKYEPCGLGQLISLRYGTVPAVRDTGGLSDTINNIGSEDDIEAGGTGIKFKKYTPKDLLKSLDTALEFYNNGRLWNKIIKNGMDKDFSWKNSAREYKKLYSS